MLTGTDLSHLRSQQWPRTVRLSIPTSCWSLPSQEVEAMSGFKGLHLNLLRKHPEIFLFTHPFYNDACAPQQDPQPGAPQTHPSRVYHGKEQRYSTVTSWRDVTISTHWMWTTEVHNCVCNKNEACREDTEGTRNRRSLRDGGSHGTHQEPPWSSDGGKGSAHVLVAQSLLNSSFCLSGRQEVTSVIALLCMTPSKTFGIR